jgi:tetratricopeptide (TPR) repeat protein
VWDWVQPLYSAFITNLANLVIQVEEWGEPVTRLVPTGKMIQVYSVLREDGEPAAVYDTAILHFYLVSCVAIVVAFPGLQVWSRLKALAVTLGLLIAFHTAALTVTVEHTYAVTLAKVAARNYSATEAAVYAWLRDVFDFLAVQAVPAATLVVLAAIYGVRGGGARTVGTKGTGGGPRRRILAGALILAALSAGLAFGGWRHLGKVRARQSEKLCAAGYRALLEGSHDTARRLFERSVALKPEFPEAHDGLGHTLLRSGDPAAALETFTRATRLDPSSLQPRLGLASALLALDRTEEAIHIGRLALQDHPGEWEPVRKLAEALIQAGRAPEAVALLGEGVTTHPDQAELRLDLARILIIGRQLCVAMPHLEAFLLLSPDSPHAPLVRDSIAEGGTKCGDRTATRARP